MEHIRRVAERAKERPRKRHIVVVLPRNTTDDS